MFPKIHINEVVEKFFLITSVPLKVFQFDGHCISSKGYNNNLNRLFDSHDIYEKLNFEILRKGAKSIITTNSSKDVYFTACLICPKNIHSDLFILGPYSSSKNNSMNIPYKPISLITDLVSFIHLLFKDIPCKQKSCLNDKVYSFHVKKAIDYINTRYKDDITLVDISNYLKINKSYFCSIFKKETGKTFTQFLNEVRINKSKELLLEDDSSILDIAIEVGYNSQNYYNIIFKKITNQSPLEFINSVSS